MFQEAPVGMPVAESSPEVHRERVAHLPSEVASVRARLAAWMADVGCPRSADALLVVSELLTNSIRHARPLADGRVLVEWVRVPEGLSVAVTDGGSETRPRLVEAGLTAVGGRGVALVQSVSRRWWTTSDDSTTTVHAVVEL